MFCVVKKKWVTTILRIMVIFPLIMAFGWPLCAACLSWTSPVGPGAMSEKVWELNSKCSMGAILAAFRRKAPPPPAKVTCLPGEAQAKHRLCF